MTHLKIYKIAQGKLTLHTGYTNTYYKHLLFIETTDEIIIKCVWRKSYGCSLVSPFLGQTV